MKNILMICFAALAFATANAQTQNGSFLIGGTASVENAKGNLESLSVLTTEPGTTTAISLAPQVGYFVIDNLAIGLRPSITYAWRGKDNRNTATGLGPFVRYYFPFGRFAVFPEFKASLNNSKQSYLIIDPDNGSSANATFKSKSTQYSGGVGFVWFAAKNVGIESILSYSHYKRSSSAGNLLSLRFGIQFYLSRNAEEK